MTLGVALALAGCSSSGETTAAASPSSNKLSDIFATPDWAKFSGGDKTRTVRAITPDDLIGADGSCAATRIATPSEPPPQPAPEPLPQQAPKPPETDGAARRESAPAAPAEPVLPGPTVAGGIALAMTECEVAQRAGYPGNVEIGSEAGGQRSVVLTYRQGPWPGIYRFRGGRLVSIERVEVIEPPKPKKPERRAKPTKIDVGRSAPQ